MHGLEMRPYSLQIYFKRVISWKVFSRHHMSQEIIIILWLLHESIAYISSLGSLNSLICLFVVLYIIILFVFSCPFFPFIPSASRAFALHVFLVIRKKYSKFTQKKAFNYWWIPSTLKSISFRAFKGLYLKNHWVTLHPWVLPPKVQPMFVSSA